MPIFPVVFKYSSRREGDHESRKKRLAAAWTQGLDSNRRLRYERMIKDSALIQIQGVTQHYGVRPVLKRIDLTINAGQLVAIIGPNGMGKSTLLGVMAGTLSPQHGRVLINGLERKSTVEAELAIRRTTVFLPDKPWLPKTQTGREFLMAVGKMYEIPGDSLLDHVDRLLKVFELERESDWPIRSYSAGQMKKIALSASLVSRAKTYLLDEPFSGGLDPSGILALKHILRRLVDHDQATVVMTTPVPELLEELADSIVVLREGEVVAHDSPAGLRRQCQCSGSLDEVIARLIHPRTLENLDEYFREE
ncbi:MAG: ABC transporter ATP-binding protein [Planctomycetes bacterium]|nr:ABC transporter ATP-binding protein [Planctomycetota bacterium]